MSLSGLNYRIIQIESKLSNMGVSGDASKAVDNSEEVAKLEAQITAIGGKTDAALEASAQVMTSSKKDTEALLQRIQKQGSRIFLPNFVHREPEPSSNGF